MWLPREAACIMPGPPPLQVVTPSSPATSRPSSLARAQCAELCFSRALPAQQAAARLKPALPGAELSQPPCTRLTIAPASCASHTSGNRTRARSHTSAQGIYSCHVIESHQIKVVFQSIGSVHDY